MYRLDTSVGVRGAIGGLFGYETVAIFEGLQADLRGSPRHLRTISGYCWHHPWLIPLILGGLLWHLLVRPKNCCGHPRCNLRV